MFISSATRDGNPDLGSGIRPIFGQILESESGIRFLIADSEFLIGRLELQIQITVFFQTKLI